MPMTSIRLAAVLLIGLVAAPAAACDQTTEIRFARGATSGEVSGMAPFPGSRCYTIEVGDAQTVRVTLVDGAGLAFRVDGVVDFATDHAFVSRRGTYRIGVFHQTRSVAAYPFRLRVAVTGGRM